MIKFLDLKKQYLEIKDEIDSAIFSVIEDNAFVGGKYVKKFEDNFAKFIGVNEAIGVGNGTDALEIALWALDLPKNSEVLVKKAVKNIQKLTIKEKNEVAEKAKKIPDKKKK